MQTLRLEIKDDMMENVMCLLGKIDDIKVENITDTSLSDIKMFEEAKKDTKSIKSIDEVLKEYNIDS